MHKHTCDNCGTETENPPIRYELSNLQFDGPENWYVDVAMTIQCTNCGFVENIEAECIN